MKYGLLVVLTAILAAGCSGDSAASEDVAARVDGTDIQVAELEKMFQSRVAGGEQPPSAEEAQEAKLQLLNQMINDKILLDLAAKSSLTATDSEVDVKFNEYKSQFTEEKFQEQLKQQKMSVDELKAEIRKGLTIEKLVNKEITSKITVSDSEIQSFYAKNKEQYNLPESFHIAHILVTPVPDPEVRNGKNDDAKTEADARAKASRLLRDVQGGMDFATVARDYSEDPTTSAVGGDLNFQPVEALSNIGPELARTVQSLRVGETARSVVGTRFGFHIVKLLEKDPGGQKDLTDPRVQSQVRQLLFGRKDQILKAAFSETARNRAKVSNFFAERILTGAGK